MKSSFLPTNALIRRVLDCPVRHSLIPQEFRLSWFVPVRREIDGRIYLTAFFYSAPAVRNQPVQIGRPRFHLTIDPESGSVVELTDCSFCDFAPAVESDKIVGALTTKDMPARTIPEIERRREELCQAYDQILDSAFKPTGQLTTEERGHIADFAAKLEAMIERPLKQFYAALNPDFFAWLRLVASS